MLYDHSIQNSAFFCKQVNQTSFYSKDKLLEVKSSMAKLNPRANLHGMNYGNYMNNKFHKAGPSRKFPLQLMSIYSNDNIRTIAKLTTRELPQKSKNAKITVRENNGLYSNKFHKAGRTKVRPQNLMP